MTSSPAREFRQPGQQALPSRLTRSQSLGSLSGRFPKPPSGGELFCSAGDCEPEQLATGTEAGGIFQLLDGKEAILKATGEGVADMLAQIEVSLVPGQAACVLSISGDSESATFWSLKPLSPAPGFIGALATRSKELRLACWRWDEHGLESLSRNVTIPVPNDGS